ncbi:putative receptor-like protein kinase [Forsythia ovata]|uniref:Receptor-like protein kinase n=1 Tax=Forsythia ovata TaxID=205694 RepID=A0ABD1P4L0_9LAMI
MDLSAPKDFFIDAHGIILISHNGIQEFRENNVSHVLETVHIINIGGSKLTVFIDTIQRGWVPGKDFLVLMSTAKFAEITESLLYQLVILDNSVATITLEKYVSICKKLDPTTLQYYNFEDASMKGVLFSTSSGSQQKNKQKLQEDSDDDIRVTSFFTWN